MPKRTNDGYIKISTLEDVFVMIGRFPHIDTIKYAFLPSGKDVTFYVALWASTEQRGYGGCVISHESLKFLRENMCALTFVDIGEPVLT